MTRVKYQIELVTIEIAEDDMEKNHQRTIIASGEAAGPDPRKQIERMIGKFQTLWNFGKSARSEKFVAYTIYGPKNAEHPGKFIVRRFNCSTGTGEPEIMDIDPPFALADSVEEARHSLPFGLVKFNRNEGDDPRIVETWL